MKQLTREEADGIKKRPDGRATYVRGVLLSMEVKEIILLEPGDWNRRTQTPKTYCIQLGRDTGRGWKCQQALDGSGWVIERVK